MANILEYRLDKNEASLVSSLVEDARKESRDATDSEFYDHGWQLCDQLPVGLRRTLEGFRRTEPGAALLVHGFPVNESEVLPTPRHWNEASPSPSTAAHEIILGMCGQVLGEPFTWATLQQGRLIQNILPIAGDEQRQNGHGSDAFLEFHTEDAFHPNRCDYLLLFGVRNPDQVATIVSSVRDIELTAQQRRVLSEPRFFIRPDTEHIRQLEALDVNHPALAQARKMSDDPQPTAALFGVPDRPYLRIDPPFMEPANGDDDEARLALDALVTELERQQQPVAIGSGTLLIVDNYMAVHGRKSFEARYDGTDRWLKKLTVSRNLRASMRGGAKPRVLF
jgi:L-asparagine oxygenase